MADDEKEHQQEEDGVNHRDDFNARFPQFGAANVDVIFHGLLPPPVTACGVVAITS